MDLTKVEKEIQQFWRETKQDSFDKNNLKNKYYVLEMFSYPSGAKLHAGHWYNYAPTDSYARFKKMQGKNVFQPMGFDAFGLPAENYAIKTGVHPKDSTLNNIATMETQLKNIGAMFDWDYEIKTCMPDYYKWTQWMFLKLYENGLAYRKEAPVNWCPSCNTVLANEQVIDGVCERCNSTVERKNLTQWFFKITNYAEELLTCLDKLDWPEKTKQMQRNWIGKSEGGEIEFSLENGKTFKVFTTRADTLFGVSYVVLAPEHPLVTKLTTPKQKQTVEQYIAQAQKSSEIERLSTTREKTGAWTGSYAINPINNTKIPVWIADYVLFTYGTGAVMGVPAHDDRDFAFAQKYNLPITRVIKSDSNNIDDTLPFTQHGVMTNSGEFNGLTSEDGINAVLEHLNKLDKGGKKINYRLRDWLVSRQRYWGAPIPIIHCDKCGTVPVPYDKLPVELPYNVEFKPDGKSPLAKCGEYINATCPICGAPAKRDPDTLDTFVCSSWYFLRYPDSSNDDAPFNSELINKMLPVDKYVGGAEHACMHLLYARFFTKALRDMGYLNFDEPFTSLTHQGLILGPDGNKMSKSKGNVISPDIYVEKFGSDVLRLYLMFGFSYIEGGPWNDNGIDATNKFLERLERILVKTFEKADSKGEYSKQEQELDFVRNTSIKKMTEDINNFSFNTAVARLMEYTNALYKYDGLENVNSNFEKQCSKDLLLLIAPFTPHFAEKLWQTHFGNGSIFNQNYPKFNEKALVKSEIELAVQINSKVKSKIVVDTSLTLAEIEQFALADSSVQKLLDGKQPKKVIVIPSRLINIIL